MMACRLTFVQVEMQESSQKRSRNSVELEGLSGSVGAFSGASSSKLRHPHQVPGS